MAKTKTKGTAKTVSDTPVPQPITIRSTNPKIMADNILKLEESIKAADVSANPTGTAEETLLTSIGIDGKKYNIGTSAEDVSYDNTDSGLTADDTQTAIDEVNGKFSTLVPCQLLQIPNIGEHNSIRLSLADNDTFCVITLIGATGTYGQYLITAASSTKIIESGYSVTKNADRDFTITCTGNWTRAVLYAFAPVPNAITYTIP